MPTPSRNYDTRVTSEYATAHMHSVMCYYTKCVLKNTENTSPATSNNERDIPSRHRAINCFDLALSREHYTYVSFQQYGYCSGYHSW